MLWSAPVSPVPRTAALALALALNARRWSLPTLFLVACGGGPPGASSQREDPQAGSPTAPATREAPQIPPAAPRIATAPAHGYGDKIAWRGLDEGLREAAELGRPLMLVVHAAWCPRCKELRQRFFDPTLAETSDRFIMVNLDQDATPEALRHGPDGTYIPRVLFFDPQGRVDPTLSNPGRAKYKYFYMPQDDLVGVMHQALDRLAPAHETPRSPPQ